MLSESQIIFIFLLFFNCITQVSSSHKIIQISMQISHLHRGPHSGNRSLYLPPSSWWCYYTQFPFSLFYITISHSNLLYPFFTPSSTPLYPLLPLLPLPLYLFRILKHSFSRNYICVLHSFLYLLLSYLFRFSSIPIYTHLLIQLYYVRKISSNEYEKYENEEMFWFW